MGSLDRRARVVRSSREHRRPHGGDRAVTPAVGKSLELGIVVLFVGFLTTVLLGGVVPEYRSAAGSELGERVLATASQEIERSIPPASGSVDASRSVELPPTIAGSDYELRVDGRWLVLDHPDPDIDGRVRLVLPRRVDRVEGYWQSGGGATVHVSNGADGPVVELRNGDPP